MKFIAVVIQIYTRSGETRLSCSRISLTPQCARGGPRSGTAIIQGMTLRLKGCGGVNSSGDSGIKSQSCLSSSIGRLQKYIHI